MGHAWSALLVLGVSMRDRYGWLSDDYADEGPNPLVCWCGSERGPRTPADSDGRGCLGNLWHSKQQDGTNQ